MRFTLPIHNQNSERLDYSFREGAKSDCLVILAHGITGNKDNPLLVSLANNLSKQGWPTLRISFSGNGKSEGKFTRSTLSKEVSDLTAVLDQVSCGKKMAYIGHSLGGAVGALTTARDERIKVMISLAGMVHTRAFVTREFSDHIPDHSLIWDDPSCPLSSDFVHDLNQIDNTLDAVAELRLPWLFVHGTHDVSIPFSDSTDLQNRLRGPSKIVKIQDADHVFNGYEHEVACAVANWLKKHL
jgi:alpha/beta superfamily hydrolase